MPAHGLCFPGRARLEGEGAAADNRNQITPGQRPGLGILIYTTRGCLTAIKSGAGWGNVCLKPKKCAGDIRGLKIRAVVVKLCSCE